MPAVRVFDREDGRHLHIVRQARDERIGLGAGVRLESDVLDAEVLPLRDGPGMQGAEGVLQRHRRGETFHRPRLPALDVLPGVEGDAGLRQAVIRRRQVHGRPIRGMQAAEPLPFPERRAIEPKLRCTAPQVRESVFAEIPEQQRNLILPFLEVGFQVDGIEIAGARVRSPLEPAFEHHQLAVHPQPVLAVHGDPGRCLLRHGLQRDVTPEGDPLVGLRGGIGTAQRLLDFNDFCHRRLPDRGFLAAFHRRLAGP